MKAVSHSHASGKIKLSGAFEGWSVEVLERFRRDAGLSTRSAALCEALAQWAREYRRDALLERAVAKYGEAYRRAGRREEEAAARMLPLVRQSGGLP